MSHAESPHVGAPLYVVRNTFVELVDEGTTKCDEASVPPFRRRRGSSFFRCSSEPAAGRSGQARCGDFPCDATTTADESSDVRSTPHASPTNSRDASPLRVAHSPVHANFPHMLQAAMSMNEQPQHRMPIHAVFPSQGGSFMMSRLDDTCNIPFSADPNPGLAHELDSLALRSPHSSDPPFPGVANFPPAERPCHLIWCDHKAFKDSAGALRQQLEAGVGMTVSTHKAADNCVRLLRKKQHAQGRSPYVILASWANAPAVLMFLADATHVSAKVVVLCDSRSYTKRESIDQLASQFPFIEAIATTWEAALGAVCNAVAACRQSAPSGFGRLSVQH